MIPVRAENFPSITVVQGNSQGSPSTRQILSDYDLNSVKGGDVRSIIHYIPTAQYQFYDLLSTSPLYNVDFQFWWVDASLTFYPLYINPNETCILKLLFVKKDDKESEPIIGYGM